MNDSFLTVWLNATRDRWSAAGHLRALADAVEDGTLEGLDYAPQPTGALMAGVATLRDHAGEACGHWYATRLPEPSAVEVAGGVL